MPSYPTWMKDEDMEPMLGERIGRGTGRNCFAVKSDDAVVVKEVHLPFYGANMAEWFLWRQLKDTDLASLFGECFAITYSGRYLIMERLGDISTTDYSAVPPLPEWLQDAKPDTFGKNALGQIKVRDYGHVSLGDALAKAPRRRRPWMGPAWLPP
jgi:hypothetical protein